MWQTRHARDEGCHIAREMKKGKVIASRVRGRKGECIACEMNRMEEEEGTQPFSLSCIGLWW